MRRMSTRVKCPVCGGTYRKTFAPFEAMWALCPFCLTWHEVKKSDVVV